VADACAVERDHVVGAEQGGQVAHRPVLERAGLPIDDEQPRGIARLDGLLGHELPRQVVVQLVGAHADTVPTGRSNRHTPRVPGAPTDESLVRAAQRGDRDAFDELVRRHRDRVYAVALRLTRNPDDAEDALQETFISAYRGLGGFSSRARVSTWLYRIATNRALDVINRRKASTSLDAEDSPQVVAIGDDYEQAALRRALEQALARLPEEFRVAVVLSDVAGLTPTEAAEVLDVPVGTMKSRVFRARAQLATMLREPTNLDAVQ
jgi:RNA polymerase sigma-70 factor (ECF subfamily)